ncbi:MAG TPA: ABC transporter permease [Roseateles sp.]|nr:ABC transporter permease [Roseateles sp.]
MLLAMLLAAAPALAQDDNTCGPLTSSYGPFDYRLERNGQLKVVDAHHFTSEVEGLLRGKTGSIGGDIDYVLHTSPNHHRALISLQRYAAKLRLPRVPDMRYSVDCFFERALRFKRDDQVARMIFVTHLLATQRADMARGELATVAAAAGDNAFTHYNLGLLYFEIKDYDKALEHAHRSQALGLQRPDLRDKLTQAGRWQEPPPPPAAAASEAQAASAPQS